MADLSEGTIGSRKPHWSRVDKNPTSPEARNFVATALANCYQGRLSYEGAIEKYVRGNNVLDVGVVEHVREFIESPHWKHRILKNAAARLVGCDIIEEEVLHLQKQGYDVRLVDATSETDLGERFQTVFIGDVIEHVNDPTKLLTFAARHLEKDGCIVVTTPCPFWFKNLIDCLFRPPFIGNVDHVDWITPFNALELANRAGLQLAAYNLVQNLGHNFLTRQAHSLRTAMGFGHSEIFSWAYIYVYKAA